MNLQQYLAEIPSGWIAAAVAVVVLLMILASVGRLVQRRARSRSAAADNLSIDITQLDASGPPDSWPRLEYYGVPVRLAVLVLAPAGRLASIPSSDKLRDLIDTIVPGLADILDLHQPVFRRWPEQLSSQGFAQTFFTNMKLPGNSGKGTPWCSVAGRFDAGDQQLLIGMVCCAASPNSRSAQNVEHAGQWHDVLRIRRQP